MLTKSQKTAKKAVKRTLLEIVTRPIISPDSVTDVEAWTIELIVANTLFRDITGYPAGNDENFDQLIKSAFRALSNRSTA